MKKIIILPVLALSLVLVLSTILLAQGQLRLIKAKGTVDASDIGGSGLYVFSLWDENKEFVAQDGSFSAVISDSSPQKLSVIDNKKMTRALAIALPKDSQRLVFDAKSTAAAILFQDPGLLRSPAGVENIFKTMAGSKSFQNLVIFLKKNLPYRPLEELMGNSECTALLEKCNDEIFGEDQQAIRKSLSGAQNKLQKLLEK